MDELFQNKYRVDSTRILDRDYSLPGLYFVTICTENRKIFFSRVVDKKMVLNQIGEMADKFWKEIPEHFNNVELGRHVVMPNHVHGIIKIVDDYDIMDGKRSRDARSRVSTPVPMVDFEFRNKFGPLRKKSLSSIIHAYKSSVKRWCNKNNFSYFKWQPRFHEHIIKNEKTLENINDYILNNPHNWEYDRNYPKKFKNMV